ncbi:Hypothetical protein AA314_02815 [Archangium gephyra]|uniref:Uncharacterized protein n=1 Tax=Archangium gephyra TaxID=48 RepID=A0AAC8Q4X4_9BACT|nr:Hypothetical protein AA314_02815 [Archangium gephyra]
MNAPSPLGEGWGEGCADIVSIHAPWARGGPCEWVHWRWWH